MTVRRVLAAAAALTLGLGGVLVVTSPAAAATFTVSNLLDSGAGSLRQAILDSNGGVGPDTITFDPTLTGTIALTSNLAAITDDLTIVGPGEVALTVSAPGTVFTLTGTLTANINVSISGLTLTSAGVSACGIDATDANLTVSKVTASDLGCSGIAVMHGALTATDVTVERDGSGIAFAGVDASDTLSLTRVHANSSSLKGISADVVGAVATISDSTMNNNAVNGLWLKATSSSAVTVQSSVVQGNGGGGIYVDRVSGGSTVAIANSTISGNTNPGSGDGGGIDVESLTDDGSSLTVSDSTISGNTSGDFGGGIYLHRIGGTSGGAASTAKATIIRTTLDGNRSGGYGAAVAINDPAAETSGLPTVLIDSSTLSNNTTPYGGGGIHIRRTSTGDPAVVKILNTTISGNDAQLGGGVDVAAASYPVGGGGPGGPGGGGTPGPSLLTTVISQSTIVANSAHTSAGVAVNQGDQTLEIDNSILAGGTSNNSNTVDDLDVGAPFTLRYSLVQAPRAGLIIPVGMGNIVGVDPQLGPLADNGGPTKTRLVSPGSPAYNAGDPAFAGAGLFDQRGLARVYQRIDMGSVEWQPALAYTGAPAPAPQTPLVGLLLLFAGLAMVAFSRLQSRT